MIIENIYTFIEYKGITAYQLAKILGISNGYLSKTRQNKGSVGGAILEKIVNHYPDLNPTWLLTGKGNMLLEQASPKQEEALPVENAPLLPLEYQTLTAQLHIKDQQISKKDEHIERKDALFEEQIKIIHRKDDQFEEQTKIIHRRDEQFEHQLRNKDQQISKKDEQIERRDEQFEYQLRSKDQQIKVFQEQIGKLIDKVK